MDTGTAVRVTYWAEQKGPMSLYDLEGAEDFRRELADNYVSVVQARPGDLGGLHQLVVEFVSSISLLEMVKFVLEGVAFDLLKFGTKAFVLQPFLHAYKKLKERNQKARVDIEELRVTFQDCSIVVYQLYDDSVLTNLESILRAVATHYDTLRLESGERPFELHVPVFEDPAPDRLCRFRVLLDVDETLTDVDSSSYLTLWGVKYDYSRTSRIYDLPRRLLIGAEFYTLEQYWSAWQARWDAQRRTERPPLSARGE